MLTQFRFALFVGLGITIASLEPASSQVKEAKKPIVEVQKKQEGLPISEDKIISTSEDKLPPGAIARLGSTWLRHGTGGKG